MASPQIPTISSLFGNPGQIFKPEVYNNILPNETTGGVSQYVVKLTSNDMPNEPIRGLLTENFSINVDASWDTLDIIGGLSTNPFLAPIAKYGTMLASVNGIANVANTGISTRKVYTQSGYLELSVKFRVVDWRGTGEPVTSAFLLSSMCLPKNLKSYTAKEAIVEAATKTVGLIENFVGIITTALGYSQESTDSLKKAIGTDAGNFGNWVFSIAELPIEGIISKIAPTITQSIGKIANDPQFLVLASAPSTISVEIGNYFKHNDMIVKNVRCDFSKQACTAGPLFADFEMSISSRQAILMGANGSNEQDLGLKVRGKGRVTTTNSTSTSPTVSTRNIETIPIG
jgi:hypothetical protein